MPSALNNVPVVAQTQVSPPPLTKEATKPIAESANFSEKNIKMKFGKNKRGSKKQIPTILGLLILFVALISGVLLFGQGTGVFAPRATPETTPKNIRISNVTDKTFTISFYTDESTIAFVKYGTDDKTLDKQASDDRDQLSGVVKDYRLHYVTVRNLDPGKNYFYVLGTGSSSFDNEGQPYNLTTAAKPSQSPSNNQTIYGTILKNDGTPAEGAIVYVNSDGIGALSSLVKSSGSWGISLANAFNTEKSNYATMTDGSMLDIKAQGIELDLTNNLQTTVATAQPVINLILDKYDSAASASASVDDLPAVDKAELLADMTTSSSADLMESTESSDASEGGNLTAEASASTDSLKDSTVNDSTSTAVAAIPTVAPTTAPPEILNLSALDETKEASATTIQTSQPQIKATLPANTMIRVVIHSDTAIDETVQTDANGNMVLDVASLGKNLEPGEHTASYTYIDPVSGKEVTKTYNFTVDPKAPRQIAAAADLKTPSKTPSPTVTKSPTPVPSIPYGSGNPFAPTISATPTASPSAAVVSTRSAIVATNSGQYNSGSVGTTVALLLGGLFFVLAGVWSYFLATSFDPKSHD
jgi:hypothetical protein